MTNKLFENYHFVIAEDLKEFGEYFSSMRSKVFENEINLNLDALLTEEELSNERALSKNLGSPYKLCIYILHKNEKIGWFWGRQTDAETFYMLNTGILPQYQNKGIYTQILPQILEILKAKGFQKVFSRHKASNNQILVPKLRAGFLITSFEISDIFGVLIHLTYFFNEKRRKVIQYRTGQIKPNDDLKEALSL